MNGAVHSKALRPHLPATVCHLLRDGGETGHGENIYRKRILG
jgi:hypothetical protein